MLKETETEETTGFVAIIFVIGHILIGGLPGYAYGACCSCSHAPLVLG